MKTPLRSFSLQNYFLCIALVATLVLVASCGRKNIDNPIVQTFNNSTQVTTSLSGRIYNRNGVVISGAQVTCSGYQTTTDSSGYFQFKHILTPQKATTVFVNAPGYFTGSRTLVVRKNDFFTVEIQLIELGVAQTFSSSEDAKLTFGNLTLSFAKNSICTKSSGAEYTGLVQVYAHELNPTDSAINLTMPGALRGLTQLGSEERVLKSYGMFATELRDVNGNELQIKPGSKVNFTLNVPNSLLPTAPLDIPLWHFEDGSTLWQEEGQATLVNGSYEGEVGHFSFWNCDVGNPGVYLEMFLKDQLNQGLAGLAVKATNTNDNTTAGGISSANGWVGGFVPINSNLNIDVYYSFYSFACGTQPSIYSQAVSVGMGNIYLGTIIIPIPATATTVEGQTLDCNNQPVADVALYLANYNQITFTNANGYFKFILPCVATSQVSLCLMDKNNPNFSPTLGLFSTYNLVPGMNNIGNYTVCDTLVRYMNYNIQDSTGIIFSTENKLPSGGTVGEINYTSNTIDFSSGPEPVYFTSQDTTVGTHPITKAFLYVVPFVNSTPIQSNYVLDSLQTSTVTITQFPPIGGLIKGSFTLHLLGQSTNVPYLSTGTFRAYRNN